MPVRKRKPLKRNKKLKPRRRRKTSKLKKFVSKKLRTLLYAVISVAISILLLLGYSAYKFINAPFSKASGFVDINNEGIWINNQSNLLAILVTDINDPYADILSLKIINLNNLTKKYRIYDIPIDVDVVYALNYGLGPFKRVYAVGNTDQNRGMYVLEKTIFKLLAVKPNGYIIMDQYGLSKIEDKIGVINKDDISASFRLKNMPVLPSVFSLIRTNSKTNMKMAEVFDVLQFFRGTSSTSSTYKKLNKYYLLDSNSWDNLWTTKINQSNINKENVKVFIANASSDPKIPGLASWGARVIKNLDADVLATQNSFIDYGQNTIIAEDLDSDTVKQLTKVFGVENVISKDSLDKSMGYNPLIFRAKISLILKGF